MPAATLYRLTTCAQCDARFFCLHPQARRYCSTACKYRAHELTQTPEQLDRWRANTVQNFPVLHRLVHCLHCQRQFVAPHKDSGYCSKTCRNRLQHIRQRDAGLVSKYLATRYARLKAGWREHVLPADIFDRDHWTCGLCGDGIPKIALVPHPLAPTLDHVIPLALGGLHEAGNLQAAHFLCNSIAGPKIRVTRRGARASIDGDRPSRRPQRRTPRPRPRSPQRP